MKTRIAIIASLLAFLALVIAAAAPKASADKSAAPAQQPDRVMIGSISAWYGAVDFMHAKHASLSGDCSSCHHNSDAQPVPCATCHPEQTDPGSPATMTLKVAYHQRCMACHKAAGSGPVGCAGCHARRALPDPAIGSTSTKR